VSGPRRELEAFLGQPRDRVVLDLGCGDARATARLAAAQPTWLVIGADANLDAAERVIRRTRRAPEKGGLRNLTIIRATAATLPAELVGRVDEARVDLPWGSLLDGLLLSRGDMGVIHHLAALLSDGGSVRIVVNARALPDGVSRDEAEARLRDGLDSAGLSVVRVGTTAVEPETGWGKRLAGGRPLEVIVAEGRRT
jgi:16S rRNA (adenine(1408)-N(1))-methyltransferase